MPTPRELATAPVWKIACGGEGRNYLDTFLDHSVALVGTWGIAEEWPHKNYDLLGRNERWSIETIAKKIKWGDIVLATRGTREALAVGVVIEQYKYNDDWAEIEGWDLFHQIRVQWYRIPDSFSARNKPFARWTAAQVHDGEVQDWARKKASRLSREKRFGDPEPLPEAQRKLSKKEIPSWVEPARKAAEGIFERVDGDWSRVSERTMVAHIVVPMLRALKWNPEDIRLEHKRADVVVMPAVADEPVLLVEAKAPHLGLEQAFDQACGYRDQWRGCNAPILVTNGLTLKLHLDDERVYRAYLLQLREGAEELFKHLAKLAPGSRKRRG